MKPHTKRNIGIYNEKYPVTSEVTGKEYLVRIAPFGDDDKYLKGCIVSIHNCNVFHKKLLNYIFKNNNGKIKILGWNGKDSQTEHDYNMINMSNLIVSNYEIIHNLNDKSILTIDKDFKEFAEWDGNVTYYED